LDARDLTPEDAVQLRAALAPALAAGATDPQLARARASSAELGGDLPAAERALADAERAEPGDAKVAQLAGRVAAERGNHAAALAYLGRAYKQAPAPGRALELAWEARAAGDAAKAREFFAKATAQTELAPAAQRGLGE